MSFMSNVGAPKVGAFRDWKEDDEIAEIFLPLPPGTTKKELVCVITSEKLHIRHVRLGKTLLRAEPLAGLVVPDESTWYLSGDLLNIVLAKQWRGQNKCDQYWGGSLATKEGEYECYMTVREVRDARAAREKREADEEAERRERVRASQAALREQEQREAEEEAAEERRRARAAARYEDDDDDDDYRKPPPPGARSRRGRARGGPDDDDDDDEHGRGWRDPAEKLHVNSGVSWQLWIALAACFVLVPLVVSYGVDWYSARLADEAEPVWYDQPE